MIMMGAYISCIILTFITAIQHLHVTGVSLDAALCLDLIVQQRVTSHRPDQDHCLAAQVFNSVGHTCDELTQILSRYATQWRPISD